MATIASNSRCLAKQIFNITRSSGPRIFVYQPSRLCSTKQLKSDTAPTASDKVARICATPPKPCPPLPPAKPPSNTNKYILLGLAGIAAGGALAYYLSQNNEEPSSPPIPIIKRKKVPATSAEIPKEVPYLLVGGGTASFSAFRAIKSNDPTAKVLIISSEIDMPYMRPPLSKELWFGGDIDTDTPDKLNFKQWNGAERSLFYEPHDFYTDPTKLMDEPNGGVAVVRGYTVKHIDVCKRVAVLTDGTEIKYNECLLATGSTPKNLDIFSAAPLNIKDKVSVFKTVEDYEKLKTIVNNSSAIAIIGGGFLGSELSCALTKYGEPKKTKIYQLFHEKGNMGKILPEYLSEWTTDRVREEGVIVIPEIQVQSTEMFGSNQVALNLSDGKRVIVDHIIVAIGSEPNVNLAKDSGLELDSKYGGYVVNAELEARRHLYVAGDAACFYDPKLGRRRVEHHDHAVVSGRLAGENMVGLKKPYKHQSMFWSDLGPKVGYEAIGIVDSTLPTVGVFAKASTNDTPSTAAVNHLDISTTSTTPAAAVTTTTTENIPSTSQEQTIASKDEGSNQTTAAQNTDNYGKGVIFYLRNDIIVGIVLWNVFNRINIARVIVSEGRKYDDLNEVAKLFEIHS